MGCDFVIRINCQLSPEKQCCSQSIHRILQGYLGPNMIDKWSVDLKYFCDSHSCCVFLHLGTCDIFSYPLLLQITTLLKLFYRLIKPYLKKKLGILCILLYLATTQNFILIIAKRPVLLFFFAWIYFCPV